MPHLDASALATDPDGLAVLSGVIRPEGAAKARLVPSWRGPVPPTEPPAQVLVVALDDLPALPAAPPAPVRPKEPPMAARLLPVALGIIAPLAGMGWILLR